MAHPRADASAVALGVRRRAWGSASVGWVPDDTGVYIQFRICLCSQAETGVVVRIHRAEKRSAFRRRPWRQGKVKVKALTRHPAGSDVSDMAEGATLFRPTALDGEIWH